MRGKTCKVLSYFSNLAVPMFQTLFPHSIFYFPFEKALSNLSNAKVVRDILVKAGNSEHWLCMLVGRQTSATTSSFQCSYDLKQVASIFQHLIHRGQPKSSKPARISKAFPGPSRNDHSEVQEQQIWRQVISPRGLKRTGLQLWNEWNDNSALKTYFWII